MASIGSEIAETLGILVQRSSRAHLYERLTVGLAPALDASTYPVLSGLARLGPSSAARVAAEIGIDRSVVSRHAARLAGAGLVAHCDDPADKRARLLVLTAAGRRAISAMRSRLAAIFDEYLATWPPGDARRFAVALARFVDEGPLRAA